MIKLTFISGERVPLKKMDIRKLRGTQISGALLSGVETNDFAINVQELIKKDFAIILRSMHFHDNMTIHVAELYKGIRLEIVLSGQLEMIYADGQQVILRSGQYHISNQTRYQANFKQDSHCSYISYYYSPEFLIEHELEDRVSTVRPGEVPDAIKEVNTEILLNSFDRELRSISYAIRVWTILHLHLTKPAMDMPGQLTADETAIIHEVDNYLFEHMDESVSLAELRKFSGKSIVFLRKGFEIVFGMGVFERHLQRRMELAKHLLENTNKPLKHIFPMVGYTAMSSFITEFKGKFGKSPIKWRKESREL